ncbi:SAM-dependent methyltransferase [Actinomadura violacea]|uniref:SAM-dependent methyltransferase n=1 Tax=Actinomadura violacea TaxID=2819934 RepID=A0ABS3RXP5_9ACTN|nr:SAM-dependent methyltransferase [Actinomadura violacea]MBO2461536.1 SAM-dependent methyltransferase [Actinomadura violacea]
MSEALSYDRDSQPEKTSPAGTYAALLGSRDAIAVDRQAADELTAIAPQARAVARANYEFSGRAAAEAVKELLPRAHPALIRVLNIGCGITTDVPLASVEDQVHHVDKSALVVGIDNDPKVLAHTRAQPGYGGVLPGDVRDVDALFTDPALRELIDLDEPMVVVLAAVLHFVPNAARVMQDLRNWLTPGSFVVLSHATTTATAQDRVEDMTEVYERQATDPIFFRSEEEIRALVRGWRITKHGLRDVAVWGRPEARACQGEQSVRVVGLVAELTGLSEGGAR